MSFNTNPNRGDYGFSDMPFQNNNSSAPPPPSYSIKDDHYPHDKYQGVMSSSQVNPVNREAKFREIINKHEISNEFSRRLQLLNGFKIVFVFDDSGSMNTILQDSPLNTTNTLFRATRWDELQYFANISIDIASLFDPNGSDVYFLNRTPTPVLNVRQPEDLRAYFAQKPNGFTPLSRVLMNVLADNSAAQLNERKLLVIIATDGEVYF